MKLFKLPCFIFLNLWLAVTANAKVLITKFTMEKCGLLTIAPNRFKECCMKESIVFNDPQDEDDNNHEETNPTPSTPQIEDDNNHEETNPTPSTPQIEDDNNHEETNPGKTACEQACNRHAFCYWDETAQTCLLKSLRDREDDDQRKSFMSAAAPHWDTSTNSFKCEKIYSTELRQYAWHWNPDIAACSYTVDGQEYLSDIKREGVFADSSRYRNYPWPHNDYYDHSKDEEYCKNLHSSCTYVFIHPGIPECKCETSDKKFHWVYGQRVCQWCEKENNEFKCTEFRDSEMTHHLEICLDGIAFNKEAIVNFQ